MGPAQPIDSPAGREEKALSSPVLTENDRETVESSTSNEPSTRVVRAPGMVDDHLRIRAVGRVSGELQPVVLILIDTGAQVSLVRKGADPAGRIRVHEQPHPFANGRQTSPPRGG